MARRPSNVGGAAAAVHVLEVMSDVSAESEEDEVLHVMDPSDPRAHGRVGLAAPRKPAGSNALQSGGGEHSRWDSEDEQGVSATTAISVSEEEEEDEDMGVIMVDEGENDKEDGEMDEPPLDPVESKRDEKEAAVTRALSAKLSSWAKARFLVSRKDRKIPEMEEPPIEPLNDFILSDFSSRFRGSTGGLPETGVLDDEDSDDDDQGAAQEDKFLVGAPLFSSTSSVLNKERGDAKTPTAAKDAAPPRKRRENRYFVTDLATKCFNCGQVGHMASVCANDKLLRPCYYCAFRGHNTFECPHLPCSSCMQLGHEPQNCTNRRVPRLSCSACGRSGHDQRSCSTVGLHEVTCMVCLEVGHLHCTPIPPPADRHMYCSYCTGNHALDRCDDYVEATPTSFTARLMRTDVKCFMCNKAGHIAAACPQRSGYSGGNSCFNCGERGHYANDCPAGSRRRNGNGNGNGSGNGYGYGSRSNSSNSHTTGRKRGRREVDDYDYEEDAYDSRRNRGQRHGRRGDVHEQDTDEDQYYYVPSAGSGSRRQVTSSYVRLDEALPSYRGSGNRAKHHRDNGSGKSRKRW